MRETPLRTLASLRRAVAALESGGPRNPVKPVFGLGLPALDAWLGGGLGRGAVHEVYGNGELDIAAASGFGLGLALGAAAGRALVWSRPEAAEREGGSLFGAGIAAFGLDPRRLLVVRARDPTATLRAAAEAARCPALGAALVEVWGESRSLDLTASRRLALAAAASGVTLVMVRLQAMPAPSAAASRWGVAGALSTPLEAGAPGRPAFEINLLRHRRGLAPRNWRLEWDRDSLSFVEPTLPRPVVPVPARGPSAARRGELRRAG